MRSSQFSMPIGVKTDLFSRVSEEKFRESIYKMNDDFNKDLERLFGTHRVEDGSEPDCSRDNVKRDRLKCLTPQFNGYSEDYPFYTSSNSPECDLETIYFDMSLFEHVWPMLFTCLNAARTHLYICDCYHTDGERASWLVKRTTVQDVIALLEDRITINGIFTSLDTVYKLDLYLGQSISARKYKINELPSQIFPTPGYTMEVEDGEFDDEIARLKGERYYGVQFI